MTPTLKTQLKEAKADAERWRRIAFTWRQVAQQRQDELVDVQTREELTVDSS